MNYNINFHETFYCNLNYIAKILSIANNDMFLSKEEISEITGIPTGKSSGKVIPHVEYAKIMNIIDYERINNNFLLKRTEMGQVIYEEDKYLQENITKLLCHYYITSSLTGSILWYDIFRTIPEKYSKNIKKSYLVMELEKKYNKRVNLSPFNGMYRYDNSLGSLNLISINDEEYEIQKHQYDNEYLYVYSYTLYKELEAIKSNTSEFNINILMNDIKWGYAFGWDNSTTLEILEILESKGIIRLNKQMNPISIILNYVSKFFLTKLYSNLI